MLKTLSEFLKKNLKPFSQPFLLGLSGGPDSLALFYGLLALGFKFEVAHIDHGWRNESSCEADYLRKLCLQYQIVFHLKTLNPKELDGNLEEACRIERLKFFKHICKTTECQAVMLAHHKDDLAETILKRLFEGANLHRVYGFSQIVDIDGLKVWRPLLNLRKQELINWLNRHGYQFFEDPTNYDPAFLRSRLRHNLIPTLSDQFGKEIIESLCRLGISSEELKDFVTSLRERHSHIIKCGPFGYLIDFHLLKALSIYEQKVILKEMLKEKSLILTSQIFETIFQALTLKKGNRRFFFNKQWLYTDRGRLFLPFQHCLDFKIQTEVFKLEEGRQEIGQWHIEICSSSLQRKPTNWQGLWEGRGEACLPRKDLFVSLSSLRKGIFLNKWWNNHKVPQFMKLWSPLIVNSSGEPIHEFLTGRYLFPVNQVFTNNIQIVIEYKGL